MQSYIHLFIYSCSHAVMHSYIYALMPSYTHAFNHALIHSFIHANLLICIHAYMHPVQAYMHSFIQTLTNYQMACWTWAAGWRRRRTSLTGCSAPSAISRSVLEILVKKERKMGYREKIKKGGINNYSILAMVNVQRSTIV